MPMVIIREKSMPSSCSTRPHTKCRRVCSPSVTMSMPACSCSRKARSTASRLPSSSERPSRRHGGGRGGGGGSHSGLGRLPAMVVSSMDGRHGTMTLMIGRNCLLVIATTLSLVGCSTERDRQWYKPNVNYTVDEFKRDRDVCTKSNTRDEQCWKERGGLPLASDKPAETGPKPPSNTIRGKY